MNDKDKEAFWLFWNNYLITSSLNKIGMDVWQAACEYKQKKIDSIDCYIERDEKIKKLQAENSKLVKCVVFYANENNWGEINHSDLGKLVIMPLSNDTELIENDYFIGGKLARQVLKELEEK